MTADGRQIERAVCFGNVYAAGSSAPDILVFAEAGDMVVLGARALEGMNLRIDMLAKQLVPAGPVPAAATGLNAAAVAVGNLIQSVAHDEIPGGAAMY
jgi:hypothetical protein